MRLWLIAIKTLCLRCMLKMTKRIRMKHSKQIKLIKLTAFAPARKVIVQNLSPISKLIKVHKTWIWVKQKTYRILQCYKDQVILDQAKKIKESKKFTTTIFSQVMLFYLQNQMRKIFLLCYPKKGILPFSKVLIN